MNTVFKTIDTINHILNACKGFTAGYTTKTVYDGYFYLEHEGKAYAVKIAEMPINNGEDSFSRIAKVQYYI